VSAVDGAGLSDQVHVALNGRPIGQPDRIPDRPAAGAGKEKWGAYVVALGLHPDEVGNYTRDELPVLADRLGG
jgi:hypothetical protein